MTRRITPTTRNPCQPSTRRSSVIAQRGSSLQSAFQQIRDLIVHGRLSPGAWIVEADLTEKLGLSRTPVRGALHWLQREGYVVEQKGRSKSRMIVAPLTKQDVRELYAIVGHIEGLAGRLTAALPRESRMKVVGKIKEVNSQLHRIAQTHDLDGRSVFDLDMEFHRVIVEASAGPRLMQWHNSIKPQTERYWRLYASNIVDYLHVAVAEHNKIISAIQKADADAAEQALIANWINGSERVGQVIEIFGERGAW